MLANFDWMEAFTASPISLVLVGLSMITLAVAMERAYYYWKRNGDPDETMERAKKKINAGDLREAKWACENSTHPMGPVAAEIFSTKSEHSSPLEERMQIALSRQKMLLERNLSVLGTMAAVAPLIGLLGTVWGIMRAFYDMAQTGSAAPSVVAAGVAEALITTAIGLIIAVPALMLYNHFSRRMNVMLTIAENNARTLRAVLTDSASHDADHHGSDEPTAKAEVARPASMHNAMRQPEPTPAR